MRQFTVSGAIGAGKSSALAILGERYPSISVVQEAVDEWSLLKRAAKDPVRWSFAAQVQILVSLMARDVPKEGVVVCERDHSDCLMFTELAINRGWVEQKKISMFNKLLASARPAVADASVLLRVDADTSMARIRSRGRESEAGMDPEHARAVVEAYARRDAAGEYDLVIDTRELTPAAVADRIASFVTSR